MKIVFATNNQHKLEEVRQILGDRVEVLSLKDIGCDADIPETGTTLEENARLKAEYVWQHYHTDVFADDTGLEVDALNGAPGVYSARYASMGKEHDQAASHDSEANMARLLSELEENNHRNARFRTVIALIQKRNTCPCGCSFIKEEHLFEGIVEGEIMRERSGVGGFGYDPIFRPNGYDKTFAQLSPAEKNAISHRGRATAKLCDFLRKGLMVFLLLLGLLPPVVHAQTGSWHSYLSYHEPQQIVKLGNKLFVRASNALYHYNLDDQSITTYDNINCLNGTYISMIALNKQTQQLIIIYQNLNIDILDARDNVYNISALYMKTMTTDKTVNDIYMYEQYAYLATGFGVVKVNMQRAEIAESYILNENISSIGISEGNIYLKTVNGKMLTAPMSKNLIDPVNWTTADSTPAGIFDKDNSDWEEYISLVSTLQPGGPKNNYFAFMRFKHGRLYTVNGGFNAAMDLSLPGNIQILKDKEWIIMPDNIDQITGTKYKDVETIDADPSNPEHFFVGARTGLYEFLDGQFVKQYSYDNSMIEAYQSTTNKSYQLIFGLSFDKEGNLWCLNSITKNQSLLQLTKDGEWISHHQKEFMFEDFSCDAMRNLLVDSRGYIWFVNEHWNGPSFYCYDPATKKVLHAYHNLINQDGTSTTDYRPHCVTEDLEGNIWVGTDKGPFVIEKQNIGQTETVTQVKVPRNDGTDYADYLLSGADIRCIAIDGGGRKWMGTEGSGLYLISADNMEEIHHFTTSNSSILSNNIYALAINGETGEVFIGTDMGLCSYMSDGTNAVEEIKKDEVYAFPNPVVSGYEGLITVRGLSLDADVKILSSSGKLIAQGRSNGGTFTWNVRDRHGRRVASGVYMVAVATKEGNKGTVCKIAVIN